MVFTLRETSFATTSYSFGFFSSDLPVMQTLSINYYILKMSRLTNIVYIGRYLALTYIERFISTVCCLFSYICWSVNCMISVSKFNNLFLTCTEIKTRFIFDGFDNVLYGKFFSDSPILFLCFLSDLYIVQGNFSCTLSVSKLYERSLWMIEHNSEMSRNVSINLYLKPCSIFIYGKFYFYCKVIATGLEPRTTYVLTERSVVTN